MEEERKGERGMEYRSGRREGTGRRRKREGKEWTCEWESRKGRNIGGEKGIEGGGDER